MTTFALFFLSVLGTVYFGFRRAPLWQWTLFLIFVASVITSTQGPISTIARLILWSPIIILVFLNITGFRKLIFTGPVYKLFRKLLPPMSETEREALEAGTVWWDAELFASRPNWNILLDTPSPKLSERERAFIDGPLNELCSMVDEWDINRVRHDLSPEVWQFLKDKGFFGMLIPEEEGGLGFSTQGQSEVVSLLASRSITLAVTVMVPNSLGPGELLHLFGTKEQKNYYLPRLAKGEEIPAFALTGPFAGSDAASMRDSGIVCKGEYKDETVIGIRLTWEKRYITLGPVATVLGLAFKLYDPDGLLGGEKDLGITLALIPTDWPGVEIGRRHFPSGQAFQNGPNSGHDVFIPMEFIIGDENGIGKGWGMLMACLAAGRAVSLPALGTATTKFCAKITTAYAQIRKQFNISIGHMEGVEEALARIVGQAYVLEAARQLTNTAIDQGQQPSVISATLKYEATERMRQSFNDAMDILGGKAICDGRSNLLFNGYTAIPVAITVEGANILTRSLIIFAQGAIRCHPWLFKEMEAAKDSDPKRGLDAFDQAFCGHIGYIIGNFCGALIHNLTRAAYVEAPPRDRVSPRTYGWYKKIGRASQNFALMSDLTLMLLGGAVKRKQRISARFADVMSELYLMSAALKRFEDDGRPEEDLPFVKWAMANGFHRIQDAYEAILQNYPSRPIAWLLRWIVFPFGRRFEPVRDRLEHEMVASVLKPGPARDRLTRGVFLPTQADEPLTILEETFKQSGRADTIWKSMRTGEKAGKIKRGYGPDYYQNAVDAGIISSEDQTFILDYEVSVRKVIDVDDFAPDELTNLDSIS